MFPNMGSYCFTIFFFFFALTIDMNVFQDIISNNKIEPEGMDVLSFI